MPFGKANSSKVFCIWTTAWCNSFHHHFQNFYSIPIALSSYVDDFFGGPIRTGSLKTDKQNAQLLLENVIAIRKFTNTKMNTEKCLSPARSMEILGIVFNSIKRTCYLPDDKVEKYISRLKYLIKHKSATKKELEQIIGNLVFAAWVLPFGRTFISHISFFCTKKPYHKT